MSKILIFTAKWPYSNNEIDGGSLTVQQYIDILKQNNIVDYLYLQKRKDELLSPIDGIHNCEIVDGNYLDYNTYHDKSSEKFEIRLRNRSYNNSLIKERIDKYDFVIIVHCLQAMGLENVLDFDQMRKVIVLPMFLSNSYRASGENVPQVYIDAEKSILQNVELIITPSTIERDYMVHKLIVDERRIKVIPRAVGREFVGNIHKLNKDCINICYIASFKKQKNNFAAILVAKKLVEKCKNVHLFLAGTIQDKNIYDRCVEYIYENKLINNVQILQIMNQQDLSLFYKKMDFAISTSLCETFGRSIFEGLKMGLPTICFQDLVEVQRLANSNKGIYFVNSVEGMVNKIIELSSANYESESRFAMQIGDKYSYETQEKRLLDIFERK